MDRPTQEHRRTGGTCPAEPLSDEEIATRRKINDGLARVAAEAAATAAQEERRVAEQATREGVARRAVAGSSLPAAGSPGTTAAELLRQCAALRASHRCPGRCVFTGELRASGMDVFRAGLDGSA